MLLRPLDHVTALRTSERDERGEQAFVDSEATRLDLGRDRSALLELMARHELVLVDWCAAAVLDPEAVRNGEKS